MLDDTIQLWFLCVVKRLVSVWANRHVQAALTRLQRIGKDERVTTADESSLERPLPTASARSLLLTVLGEFAFPEDSGVWTTALVRVLGGLGVESHAARQAITRSADAGWIEGERFGRTVRWRLTAEGKGVIKEGLQRAASFLGGPEPWDGRWLVLLVSIPQRERTTRKRLYGALSWLRMGNPTAGVWLTPHVDAIDELRSVIDRFGVGDTAMCFTGGLERVGLREQQIVGKAWNLSELADAYNELLARYSHHRPAAGDEVLFNYLELGNLLQRFMRRDPQLPEELLPNWVGHQAAELIRACRVAWAEPARKRWAELLAESTPGLSA